MPYKCLETFKKNLGVFFNKFLYINLSKMEKTSEIGNKSLLSRLKGGKLVLYVSVSAYKRE